MNKVKNHFFPSSIDELLNLLNYENSQILAGGTDLSLNINPTTENIIDLQNLELKFINESSEGFSIGALTTAYDLYTYKNLPQSLHDTAFKVSDMPLLHAVTVGGNLAKLYPWCDLPPMLWALNAKVTLYEQDGSLKEMSADEFFTYSKDQNVSNRNSFIKEIFVPKPPENSFSQYQKFGLTEIDKGQVNMGSFLSWDDKKVISEVRLVVSAITKTIQRLNKVEALLVGKKLTNEIIASCEKLAIESIEIVPNYKSSIEFRSQILKTYLRRTLQACMEAQA